MDEALAVLFLRFPALHLDGQVVAAGHGNPGPTRLALACDLG